MDRKCTTTTQRLPRRTCNGAVLPDVSPTRHNDRHTMAGNTALSLRGRQALDLTAAASRLRAMCHVVEVPDASLVATSPRPAVIVAPAPTLQTASTASTSTDGIPSLSQRAVGSGASDRAMDPPKGALAKRSTAALPPITEHVCERQRIYRLAVRATAVGCTPQGADDLLSDVNVLPTLLRLLVEKVDAEQTRGNAASPRSPDAAVAFLTEGDFGENDHVVTSVSNASAHDVISVIEVLLEHTTCIAGCTTDGVAPDAADVLPVRLLPRLSPPFKRAHATTTSVTLRLCAAFVKCTAPGACRYVGATLPVFRAALLFLGRRRFFNDTTPEERAATRNGYVLLRTFVGDLHSTELVAHIAAVDGAFEAIHRFTVHRRELEGASAVMALSVEDTLRQLARKYDAVRDVAGNATLKEEAVPTFDMLLNDASWRVQ